MLFSTKDIKSGKFGVIFECENEECAIDEVICLFKSGKRSGFTDNPRRFDLYKIGGFNSSTGVLISETPKRLGNFFDFKYQAIEQIRADQLEDSQVSLENAPVVKV